MALDRGPRWKYELTLLFLEMLALPGHKNVDKLFKEIDRRLLLGVPHIYV